MKIIFFGTPEFGAIILDKLCQTNFKPVLVATAPDKPTGRKQILTPPPVKLLAQKHGIPILQPEKIQDTKYEMQNTRPDLIIVASYGQILPKEILEIPKHGCLNVHPSLLPKYRGASPVQYAVLNGEKESGVTIMLIDEKMDHGPIIANVKCKMKNEKITYLELKRDLAEVGAKLLVETIPKWINKEIQPIPQDDSKATYTKILKKEDGKIDWSKPAEYIERQVRAFDPWPGTYALYNNQIIKIFKADVLEQTTKQSEPLGKTFLTPEEKIAVQTSKYALLIEELQLEGKQRMNYNEFLRGRPNFIGTILL